MIKKCRVCNSNLNFENTTRSFLNRGNWICRKCDQREISDCLAKNRRAVIERLGSICHCCGIKDHEILSIDHLNGGGIKDRYSFSKWKNYIKHLLNMPIADLINKYRCLCYNCNYTRGFWGKCPHQFSTDPVPENLLITANHGKKYNDLPPEEYKERKRGTVRIIRLINKLEMIRAYGSFCTECHENHPLFLTLDHINNNGNLETKCRGVDFYQYLKSFGYPGKGTQLQLLCHNCNARKEYINRRLHKNEFIKTEPEIYMNQPYNISKKEKEEIKNQARQLYYLIKC